MTPPISRARGWALLGLPFPFSVGAMLKSVGASALGAGAKPLPPVAGGRKLLAALRALLFFHYTIVTRTPESVKGPLTAYTFRCIIMA